MHKGDLVLLYNENRSVSLSNQFSLLRDSLGNLLKSHANLFEARAMQIEKDFKIIGAVSIFGMPLMSAGLTILAFTGIGFFDQSNLILFLGKVSPALYIGAGLVIVSLILSIVAFLRMRRVRKTARAIHADFRTDVENYLLRGTNYDLRQ